MSISLSRGREGENSLFLEGGKEISSRGRERARDLSHSRGREEDLSLSL